MSKEIIENYMNVLWNKKNSAIIGEVFSENVVIHSPLGTFSTRQSMFDAADVWIQALPDIQVDLLHTLEENGLVISHWSAKGTHEKELLGVQPSKKSISYNGVTIYRFEGDKVVEYWAYLDTLALKEKLRGV